MDLLHATLSTRSYIRSSFNRQNITKILFLALHHPQYNRQTIIIKLNNVNGHVIMQMKTDLRVYFDLAAKHKKPSPLEL